MGTASDISYDISGEDVVEVRATPATEAAANLEAFKAAGSAKVAAKDWAGAIVEYEKCVTGYEACKETVSSDFEAERSAEKCALASLSNQALCALKLEDFEGAKAYCGTALKRLKEARVVDESAMAKCHFRKGQAFYGLGDARGAVDAYNDAIALEERQLDKCATDESKKKAATIVSMKRELLKARRAAKEQAKTAASNMSGARGFLKAGARGTGDPKEERKQLIVEKIDCALSFVFSDKDTKGKDAEQVIAPNYDAMIDALVAARHGACAAKDLFGELALTFAEGFVAFLASAPEAEASPGRAKYYARCVDAMASYWQLRDELAEDTCDTSLLEPPMNIGDVAALECAAHAHMQLGRHAEARPFFEKFVECADAAGPLMAYHNLPDSFLLSRGMQKMDDKARRVSRWKHRAHSPRALFDARTALAAICAASHQKSAALDHNAAAFGHAADDEEKYTCHKNAAHLLRQAAENPDDPDHPIPASSDDLQVAQHHDDEAAALEAKIKAKGDEPDTKTNKIGAAGDDDDDAEVPGDDDAPEEFVGDDEELPPIDGVDAFDVPIDEQ